MDVYTDFEFDSYQMKSSNKLPTVQLITAKDKSLPFGFFLPTEQAANVEFEFDSWEYIAQFFKKDLQEIQVDGFITKRVKADASGRNMVSEWIRMVVLRSTRILVYGPDSFGKTKPLGFYYNPDGTTSELGLKAETDRDFYHRATRHVVYFVDENNKPIHSSPLQFKSRGGFGGCFGSELKLFRMETDTSFFAAARMAGKRLPGNSLDVASKSLGVFAFRLGLRENTLATGSQGALSCFIAERMVPTAANAKIGTVETVNRKARVDFNAIKINYVDWRSLFIPRSSDFGTRILADFDSFKEWGEFVQQKQSMPSSVSVDDFDDWDDRPQELMVRPQSPRSDRKSLERASDEIIGELGWDSQTCISYLERFYGVRSRQKLTDEQYIHFVGDLQKQAAEAFA